MADEDRNDGIRDELAELDALAQADLVHRGLVSPAELVDAAIARVERLDGDLNAVIHRRFDRAREEAARVTPGEAPFAGVPMVVKDLGCAMAGEPHHKGIRVLRDLGYLAPADSALYRRFRAAGFVVIGRTNTPEMGSTITTEPLAYGPTRNPWALDHSPGGSSGGSAAAVAAAMVPVAHGNDGGGSIRIPASACGLVGLKPSRGRVSQAPDVGESWAGATIDGVLTGTVRDAAAVLGVIAGYEPGDPYTAPPFVRPLIEEVGADVGTLRIGVLDHPLLPGSEGHPECAAAVALAARLLEGLGHHVEESWPEAMEEQDFPRRYLTIIAANTAFDLAELASLIGREPGEGDLEPDNLTLGAIGRSVSASDYLSAVSEMHAWSRRMLSWWHGPAGSGDPLGAGAGFDLLLTPTQAMPPPLIGHLAGPGGGSRVSELLQYTAQFNVTGQPAISLPLHRSADGLPIGVQLVAAAHREDLLIRVAAELEQVAPWVGFRPAVHA
jgi:amidase